MKLLTVSSGYFRFWLIEDILLSTSRFWTTRLFAHDDLIHTEDSDSSINSKSESILFCRERIINVCFLSIEGTMSFHIYAFAPLSGRVCSVKARDNFRGVLSGVV
eukprot:gb/GECG01012028.1/.p1 GENE.gb/GECG01012028.1/~~gb/GECG01012028.1/.p1  ORF type:complete len:105 (+),score=8.64 gb/GECG01012028.1/:1-315(+)